MPRSPVPRLAFGLLVAVLLLVAVTPVFAQSGTHVVQPGENLFRIALRYGVDVDALAQANGITNTWQIYAGQTLTLPGSGPAETGAVPQPESPLPAATTPVYHTVQRGEYLASIARAYGLTPEQLIQLNNLANPNLIYAGQQLLVSTGGAPVEAPVEAAEAPAPEEAAAPVTSYTVQPGDHLASIAARFGLSWTQLAQANNLLNADHIQAGQQLIIPSASSTALSPDLGIVEAPAAPPAVVTTGRSIIVDLSDSRIYAYENGQLVRNVLVSTGLPATPTVTGDFAIQRKYVSQLMTGPGYYLPDVPYVLYFYQGYAIHGTYWHNNFGVPMSHGCVNLPTPEAEWFFHFADIGTPVRVQY
ncbi:MAG: LysM peptidoglycan-binding domain-containing protein [Chloroflexota bacterium]|nr:MAG: hypothetical protein DIU68_19265 [Chloroflexota bacterium]